MDISISREGVLADGGRTDRPWRGALTSCLVLGLIGCAIPQAVAQPAPSPDSPHPDPSDSVPALDPTDSTRVAALTEEISELRRQGRYGRPPARAGW
jgi:hypothetical protein